MFRKLIVVTAVLVGGMIAVHTTLSNGSFLRYLDSHPDPRWIPAVEYVIGETYYLFQDIPSAAVYFLRVPQRYPFSAQADDAYFGYLQCQDDTLGISRDTLIEEDQKYLSKFPYGDHVAVIRDRIDALKSR